jgi:uncharacterized membrane protein YqaE (UPF0057 family)
MKTGPVCSVFAFIAAALLLSSCAFLQKGEFAQRKYYDFPRTRHSGSQTASTETKKQVQPENIAENEATVPVLSAAVNRKEIIASRIESIKHTSVIHTHITPSISSQRTEPPLISFKKSDIKKQARMLVQHSPRSDSGMMLLMMVIAAIFLPPLGVLMKDQYRTSKWFWISVALCILAVVSIGFPISIAIPSILWLGAAVIALMDVFDVL